MDLQQKEIILKEYFSAQDDIEFAILFGSVASGNNNIQSDIDIGVYFQESNDKLALGERQIDITSTIMDICHLNRVDIVILNFANPFLRFQIIKNGHLLSVKEERIFYKFKAFSFSIYQDIKPMYDFYNRQTEESLRKGING